MTRLTLNELNISSASISSTLTIGNTTLAAYTNNEISIGQSTISSSMIDVGSVSIAPGSVTTPSLILGGVSYAGGKQGGIISYQEFTANGTWYNPLYNTDFDYFANTSLYNNLYQKQ